MRINEEITSPEVRVVSPDGKQLGVVKTNKAVEMAVGYNLDLVEVAPNASPPVCRIMDYGKYKYQLSKKEKISKKKQHVIHVKEIRLRPTIDSHDIATKMRQSRKFLEEGNHVRIRILFRGRQIIHPELGQAVLERVQQDLGDIAVMEKDLMSEEKSIVATFVKK
ncbi:MAG TPA: translation initiation factor IF-3 [bacterium]